MPWLPPFQTACNPMPDQGHPEMDGLACLLEIPTRLCCSSQLPLRVCDCLFIIGAVLELEPKTSLRWIKPGFYPSPLFIRKYFFFSLSLSSLCLSVCLSV